MSTGGSRFTRRYTDEQRMAILEAHLIRGLPAIECARRAMAGSLKDGLEPFGRTEKFAYDIIINGRDLFEAENPEALHRATQLALRDAHLANLRALREAKNADPAERARLAKALAETDKARRQANTTPKATAKREAASTREPENNTPEPQSDVLTGLLAHTTNVNTPQSQSDDANTEQNGAGPVRSLAR